MCILVLELLFNTQDEQCCHRGTTDGTFRGVRYFHCKDNCGLFVALDKLSADAEGSTLTNEPRSGGSYAKVASRAPLQSGQSHHLDSSPPAVNTRSRSQAVSRPGNKESSVDPQLRSPRFQKGDRVVAFNKKGIRVHGTVRWVGRSTVARKFTLTVVGIETVSTQLCCVLW